MSVYDDIVEWIAGDVVQAIEECDDLSLDDADWLIQEYIDSNMKDLWDSMLARKQEIRKEVVNGLNGI